MIDGAELKKKIRALGVTQAQFAELAGLKTGGLSLILRGVTKDPRSSTVTKIEDALKALEDCND